METAAMSNVKARKSPLIDYMQKSIVEESDNEDVRKRLSKITSSMAEELIVSRAERL